MKLKLICALVVVIGLCATSCRGIDEMDDNTISIENKTIDVKNIKVESTVSATIIESETKDPPKTEQQWKTEN